MQSHPVRVSLAALSLGVAFTACKSPTPREATSEHEVTRAAVTSPKADTTAHKTPTDESWNPQVALRSSDPRYKQLVTRFVASPTSICPSPQEAVAESCGNSVEFAQKGYKVGTGERVSTLGEPVDGLYRAIRYMKPGLMPSWVRADRIQDKPDLTHMKKIVKDHEERCLVATAADVDFKAWKRSKKPCLVITDLDPLTQTTDWGTGYDVRFTIALKGQPPQHAIFVSGRDEQGEPNGTMPPFADIYEDNHMYHCDEVFCDRMVLVLQHSDRGADELNAEVVGDRYGRHLSYPKEVKE